MQNKKAAIGFIFFTILIDVIGFGLIIPVFPKLIMTLENCDISKAASITALVATLYAAIQFFAAPIIGSLSDAVGRRPVLLFSLLGFGLDYILQAFAPNLAWLIVGRCIAGVTGASFSTASAYIADISDSETRAKNFGMVGAAFGIGFIIGPALGGFLAGFGIKIPFFAAAALSLFNAIYGYFILPESLPKENRKPFSFANANAFASFKFLASTKILLGLSLAIFFLFLGSTSIQCTWSFYTIEKFKWTEQIVGISLAVVGICVGLVQGLLTKKFITLFGKNKALFIGFCLYAIGAFLFGIATEGWMIFVFLLPYCMGGISQPALQAIMSENVLANEQGKLQGSITSLQSLSFLIGSYVMIKLFSIYTTKGSSIYLPGAPYFLGSLLFMIAAIICYTTLKKVKV